MRSGDFIFDPTAGQFGGELASVTAAASAPLYVAEDDFPCAHENNDMLYAEARRAFGNSDQAELFVDMALGEVDEGYGLVSVSRG